MSASLLLTRVGPLTSIQDSGRTGALHHGITASGPMDRLGWCNAGCLTEGLSETCIEFTTAGLDFVVENEKITAGFAGGDFSISVNGRAQPWPTVLHLEVGDMVCIKPGKSGNYGYARFNANLDVPKFLGSRSTNTVVKLGGLLGRALEVGDRLELIKDTRISTDRPRQIQSLQNTTDIRVIWGIHADLFSADVREKFVNSVFTISPQMNRMGVKILDDGDVFASAKILSLVSDSVVAGDIQILGDSTPIVLMRDHQPTGGYPRIATVISADINRFAQMRPGSKFSFRIVSLERAQKLARKAIS